MDGIIQLLVRIDKNVKAIREQVVEDDDGEEEADQ